MRGRGLAEARLELIEEKRAARCKQPTTWQVRGKEKKKLEPRTGMRKSNGVHWSMVGHLVTIWKARSCEEDAAGLGIT